MLDQGIEPASNIRACSHFHCPGVHTGVQDIGCWLCSLELVRMQPKHLNLGLEAAWRKDFTVRHLLGIHHGIHRAGCWDCWRAAADAPLARSCELPLAWKPLPSQV